MSTIDGISVVICIGQCGAENTNVINIPESARTVEIVLNNLSPTAHVVHLHGSKFKVINYADFPWCALHKVNIRLLVS